MSLKKEALSLRHQGKSAEAIRKLKEAKAYEAAIAAGTAAGFAERQEGVAREAEAREGLNIAQGMHGGMDPRDDGRGGSGSGGGAGGPKPTGIEAKRKQLRALKDEALALRRRGSKTEALVKLREAKALERAYFGTNDSAFEVELAMTDTAHPGGAGQRLHGDPQLQMQMEVQRGADPQIIVLQTKLDMAYEAIAELKAELATARAAVTEAYNEGLAAGRTGGHNPIAGLMVSANDLPRSKSESRGGVGVRGGGSQARHGNNHERVDDGHQHHGTPPPPQPPYGGGYGDPAPPPPAMYNQAGYRQMIPSGSPTYGGGGALPPSLYQQQPGGWAQQPPPPGPGFQLGPGGGYGGQQPVYGGQPAYGGYALPQAARDRWLPA